MGEERFFVGGGRVIPSGGVVLRDKGGGWGGGWEEWVCVSYLCCYTAFRPFLTHAATSPRVTASHPNSEVKLGRVWVVLPSGTGWEGQMLHVF